jgi:hypothetical protein
MNEPLKIDPQLVRQLAELAGLDLSLDRAVALLPGLQEILETDARIAQLDLGVLTIAGLPWSNEAHPDDQR